MTDEAFENLSVVGQAAGEAAPGGVDWSWEDRFQAALLVLECSEVAPFFAEVGTHCEEQWSSSDVAVCSVDVAALVTEMAGLRNGQQLLVRRLDEQSFAYFTSWPWDDMEHVSIRFGVFYPAGELTDYAISNISIRRGLGIAG
jgi:hypothetical protein